MFQLQEMRNQKHLKWAVYVFFGLVIISFVFFYGWKPSDKGDLHRTYATLKSGSWNPLHQTREITGAELQWAEQRAIESKLMLLGPQYAQQLPRSARERLVTMPEVAREAANELLLKQLADQYGLRATREELVKVLAQQPGMSDEQFEMIARANGMDKSTYLNYLTERQTDAYLRSLVMQSANASLYELWQEYQLTNDKITLDIAAYPTENYESQVVVTDPELEVYLAEHKAEFKFPDQRRYAYVKLTKQEIQDRIAPTDEQLQAYFEQNQSKYLNQAAIKTEEIVAPLSADRSTTEVIAALDSARERAATADWLQLAEELTSKSTGLVFYRRESPWLTKTDTASRPEIYLERAHALADDVVSTPILDMQSVYMIRVIERRAEGMPALADIRDRVLGDYKEAQAEEQFKAEKDKWLAERKTKSTFADFVQSIGIKDELTTRINKTESFIPGLGSLYRDRDYIQSLELNVLSDVIATDAMLAVMQVVEEVKAYDPPLAEVRDKVETAMKRARAADLAKAAAEQSLTIARQGADFNAALADAPKPPVSTEPFKRTESVSTLGAPLIGFTTQSLSLAVGQVGLSPYGSQRSAPIGYAIWKVKEIQTPTQEDFQRERAQFEQDYLSVARLTILREFLADQRRKADFALVTE